MPEFGRYETVRELSQHGRTTIYSARPVRSQEEPRQVVKTFTPISATDQASRDISKFLKGARAQQKAAAGEARCWAPILECGAMPGGAFYVTQHYPRTLEQLLSGRVRLTSPALARIIHRITSGLIQLKQSSGRAHGNLKPSNVLISGARDIARAETVLSDPAESAAVHSPRGEAADLRAVGGLLYQLVVHEPFDPETCWPIRPSAAWARFEKTGEKWRSVCERLLAPEAERALPTLEELSREIALLREDRLVSPARLALSGLAVLVAVALLFGIYSQRDWIRHILANVLTFGGDQGGEAKFDAQKWKKLCEDYNNWFGRLYSQLDEDSHAERWAEWEKDEHLKANVRALLRSARAGKVELNPKVIAQADPRLTFRQLMTDPPEHARTSQAAEQCLAAAEVIAKLEQALTAGWPLSQELRRFADEWRQRGWNAPARRLELLLKGIDLENPDLTDGIDAILAAKPAVVSVQENWSEIQRASSSVMTGSGFPPAERFVEDYVLKRTRSEELSSSEDAADHAEALEKLAGELQRLKIFADRLEAYLGSDWKKVDQAKLKEAGVAIELPPQPITTADDLDHWLSPLKPYYLP